MISNFRIFRESIETNIYYNSNSEIMTWDEFFNSSGYDKKSLGYLMDLYKLSYTDKVIWITKDNKKTTNSYTYEDGFILEEIDNDDNFLLVFYTNKNIIKPLNKLYENAYDAFAYPSWIIKIIDNENVDDGVYLIDEYDVNGLVLTHVVYDKAKESNIYTDILTFNEDNNFKVGEISVFNKDAILKIVNDTIKKIKNIKKFNI